MRFEMMEALSGNNYQAMGFSSDNKMVCVLSYGRYNYQFNNQNIVRIFKILFYDVQKYFSSIL